MNKFQNERKKINNLPNIRIFFFLINLEKRLFLLRNKSYQFIFLCKLQKSDFH